MCTFLSISYKDVIIGVLLFTYFTLYFVRTAHGTHNGYLHIHILLYSVLFYYTVHFSGIKYKSNSKQTIAKKLY